MSGEEGELARNLGFLEAMTMGGGTMIGAGIFILPGIAAEGAGPASSISFAIAGLVALLAAVSLSELATGMPIAGGSYHYVNRGLGSFFGSIVGWGMWTGLMFASAFYMIGFGQYIVEPLPFLDGRALIILWGLLGLSFLVGVNYYGTDESTSFQNVMIGSETAIILVYLAVGVFFVEPANLEPFAPTGPSGIVATTGLVFVTFLGFEIIATIAEEVKNPGRNIPLTMILSVASVTVLYMIVMVVSTGVVPYDQLGDSLVPVSDVAEISMGTAGVVAIVVAAVIAAISSSNSSILAAARVVYAMGRDGQMTDWLNATHSKFLTPHRAVMTTGAITGLLVLAGLWVGEIVELLAEVASFSFLVSYALVHVSVVVFRRSDPEEYDPDFEIPGPLYPLVPILGVIMSGIVITQMEPSVVLIGLGIIALAIGWYLFYARDRVTDRTLIGEAIVEPSGSDRSKEGYRVVVPVAEPETQEGLLRLAAASAHSHAEEGTPEIVAINVIQVPSPTSLEQNTQFQEERVETQRALLESAREAVTEMDVAVRTRAITGRDSARTILDVVEEEEADEVVIGWSGTTKREDLFGSTLDPVLKKAPCEVSIVDVRGEVGRPMALAGPGPHAPTAEFASISGERATLLNVQTPVEEDAPDPVERGEAMIEEVAEEAGVDPESYESRVLVGEDVATEIVGVVDEYDTVCIGVSTKSSVSKILYGSVADRVREAASGTVAMIRGPYEIQRGVREAIAERLAD